MAYVKKEYVPGDTVLQARQALKEHQSNKPGAYTSAWEGQLTDLLEQIGSRQEFQYDLSGDALWKQYADQYTSQGRQAMLDTMGRAQAMTGGYGSSYAQTAGQQTYQGYLRQLNSMVPQFYQMALDRYQTQTEALLNQYQLTADQEDRDYSRWQQALEQHYAEADRLQGIYEDERSFDYSQWADEQSFAYDRYRDEVEDQQWQETFDDRKAQNALAYQQWLQEFEYQKQQDQLAYDQWLQEFQEDQRRYEQEWAAQQASNVSSSGSRSSGGTKSKTESEDTQAAQSFVDRMLASATSSRFDPERVISGTSALTEEQKKEAQSYLKTLLEAGRMK